MTRIIGKLMTGRCWNCADYTASRIRLCPVCSRTYGLGAFVGGLLVGALVRWLS